MDLLKLSPSHQGSKYHLGSVYLLIFVDNFSRYIVLVPVKEKTVSAIAHALIASLICPYSTPGVLLSDNGKDFRNALLEGIYNMFSIM